MLYRSFLLLFLFRSLCAVLGTCLKSVVYSGCIKGSSNDVVSYAGKVFYSSASDKNNAVLLEVVTDTRNIRCYLDTVSKTNSGYFSER